MKKVMFALAIAGMFSFAACNNAANEEEVVDTVNAEVVETEVVEPTTDTTVEAAAEEVAAEETATEEAAQ